MKSQVCRMPGWRIWITGIAALVLLAMFIPAAWAAESAEETAIVWVVDVSGSVPEIDPQRYWADTVSLGVDLAPVNTSVAYIAVSDAVVAQTPLLDVSKAENRAAIKASVLNTACVGYTDFRVGLSAALDILAESEAKYKHIFFVADFSESGFMLRDRNYDIVGDDMATLADRLANSAVKTHLLFLREPLVNHGLAPLWDDLANKTGGVLLHISDPGNLPQALESCYFDEFAYNMAVITGVNTTDSTQDIPIKLPAFALDRVRIYILSGAMQGMQARADGEQLAFSETKSYFMIDLVPPMPETVTLTLPPIRNGDVHVNLLSDGSMSLTAAVNSEAVKDETANENRQKTRVRLTPFIDNTPLLKSASALDANWTIGAVNPDGEYVNLGPAEYINGAFVLDFYPDMFGVYTFTLALESQGIKLSAGTTAEISEITLTGILVRPFDYAFWIALAIGLLLILTAIVITTYQRRKQRLAVAPVSVTAGNLQPGWQEVPAGIFTGKLVIYGILVEGGKTEIPATSVQLETFDKSRSVTLAMVLELADIPYHYSAAAHIHLMPGPSCVLNVKNNSDAVIYCSGQAHYRGQQSTLYYGQKMRVVFENEISEYDIFYHNAVQMAVTGDHIHMELVN